MLYSYLQTIQVSPEKVIPFRLCISNEGVNSEAVIYNFRPEISIPNRIYVANNLDKLELFSGALF